MQSRPKPYRSPAQSRAASMMGRIKIQAAIDNEIFVGVEDFARADENEIVRELRFCAFGSKQEPRS